VRVADESAYRGFKEMDFVSASMADLWKSAGLWRVSAAFVGAVGLRVAYITPFIPETWDGDRRYYASQDSRSAQMLVAEDW